MRERRKMDRTDKDILREVQSRLPIDERPFLVLAKKLGLTEEEVIQRLKGMKESGVIRRIGGNFFSDRLGFSSTLCAARVPPEKFDAFVECVNSFPGVTHNYRREHDFNVWFTFIAPSMEEIDRNLKDISRRTGVEDICSFPSRRLFKIKVDFPV